MLWLTANQDCDIHTDKGYQNRHRPLRNVIKKNFQLQFKSKPYKNKLYKFVLSSVLMIDVGNISEFESCSRLSFLRQHIIQFKSVQCPNSSLKAKILIQIILISYCVIVCCIWPVSPLNKQINSISLREPAGSSVGINRGQRPWAIPAVSPAQTHMQAPWGLGLVFSDKGTVYLLVHV